MAPAQFTYNRQRIMPAARTSLAMLSAAVAAIALPSCGVGAPEPQGPPNIIFLMADDMGYGDPGSFNADSRIPTPRMDALAADGMRFTDAHSGSAVCTPTRYGVLTGRYAWRSPLKKGVLSGYSRALIEPDRATVASMLKERGYHTAVIGKWHLGLDWATVSEPDTWDEGDKTVAFQGASDFARPEGLEIDFTRPVTNGPATLGFDYSYIIPASLGHGPLRLPGEQRLRKARHGARARSFRRPRVLAAGRGC